MKRVGTDYHESFEENIKAINHHEARMYAIARNPFSPIISLHKSNFQEISNKGYNPKTNYIAKIKKIGVYRYEDFDENIETRNFDEAKMYAIARHPFAPLLSLHRISKKDNIELFIQSPYFLIILITIGFYLYIKLVEHMPYKYTKAIVISTFVWALITRIISLLRKNRT